MHIVTKQNKSECLSNYKTTISPSPIHIQKIVVNEILLT